MRPYFNFPPSTTSPNLTLIIMNRFSQNKSADHLIPSVLKEQLRHLSDAPVIKVKTRKNGITSGEKGRCYWNANLCAQSFGGEPIYGWAFLPPANRGNGITKLIGHGCWLTPEGVVVNSTTCNVDEILFLPTPDKLQLNGLSFQEVPDLYYLERGWDKCALFNSIANFSKYHVSVPASSMNLFWGLINENNLPLDQIFLPRFFLDDHVKVFKHVLTTSHSFPDPNQVRNLFSPYIETRIEHMRVQSHQPGFSIDSFARSAMNASIPLLKILADTCIHIGCIDSHDWVRDVATQFSKGYKHYLVNPSLHSGKSIFQIPPCRSLLDTMIPKGNKKKIRKIEKLASDNNLSVQELLLMNDPFYTPHPYLINKSKGLVRI